MKLVAKQRNYKPHEVAASESDIDDNRMQVTILGLNAGMLNKSKYLKSPVLFIRGDVCGALDVTSLHVALAACTLEQEIPVWEIDIDAFELLVKAGGDFRKDIEVDGKVLYEYLGFTKEQVEAEGAEPPDYSGLIKALVDPSDGVVQS